MWESLERPQLGLTPGMFIRSLLVDLHSECLPLAVTTLALLPFAGGLTALMASLFPVCDNVHLFLIVVGVGGIECLQCLVWPSKIGS